MIKVRKYEKEDYDSVRKICANTSSEPFKSNADLRETCLKVFCDYYIEREPQNCFVAVDDNGTIAGYILCAIRFDKWKEDFYKHYLAGSTELTRMMGQGSIDDLSQNAKEFPAHLHIDISEQYQHQEIGTMLWNALKEHLLENSVKGIQLGVAADNAGAISYYKKMGFTLISEDENELCFGMKLS